jgi:hypothetical protein
MVHLEAMSSSDYWFHISMYKKGRENSLSEFDCHVPDVCLHLSSLGTGLFPALSLGFQVDLDSTCRFEISELRYQSQSHSAAKETRSTLIDFEISSSCTLWCCTAQVKTLFYNGMTSI